MSENQSLKEIQRDPSMVDDTHDDIRSNNNDLFNHNGLKDNNRSTYNFLQQPLKLSDFKAPDHLVTIEKKKLFKQLRQRFNKIDDAFLSLFEKKYIIFMQDGTDLKGELANSSHGNPFDQDLISQL